MPITVQELLDLPHLGCELAAGESGIHRDLIWAHVCELEDPMPWLEGGELVMTTGIAIPSGAARQSDYLSRLVEAGAAALAVSKDLRAPPLTDDFIRGADDLGFPILLVSIEVPFVVITRVVIMSNHDAAYHEIVRQLSVFDALRAEGATDAAALFRRLEDVSGYQLFLSSLTGAPLLPGVPPFPDEYRHLLTRPPETPAYAPGGYALSVPFGGRTTGMLLGLRRSNAESGGLPALQHIATISALHRSTLEREREIERREGSELLAELLNGTNVEDLGSRVTTHLRDDPISLYLVDSDDVVSDSSQLHQHLTDTACDHLILSQQEIVLVVPTDSNDTVAELLRTLSDRHSGRSRSFRLDGNFPMAEHQARLALSRATQSGEYLVDASTFTTELDWLPADASLREAFQDRVLGPIFADPRGQTLIDTLRVWLQHGRRPGEAARRLGIHPHTLAYRLQRVAALTGRDLSLPGTVAELWLALETLAT